MDNDGDSMDHVMNHDDYVDGVGQDPGIFVEN
jgi:hypothetical protein